MRPDKSEKAKALDLALSHIEHQFGRGSLMRLGAAGAVAAVAVIPTGSLALDAALGVGGIPRGRITEIYGPEASGKTTLARLIAAASGADVEQVSAVTDGIAELKQVIARARGRFSPTVLIVDEIHRWSRSQQAALPRVHRRKRIRPTRRANTGDRTVGRLGQSAVAPRDNGSANA